VLQRDGNDYLATDQLGYTSELGTFASFTPAENGTAWALYGLFCGSHNPTGLTLYAQPGSQGIFVGLADYASGRWRFSGPFEAPNQPDPAQPINIPLPDSAVSPQGSVHVLLALHGGETQAVVKGLELGIANWQDAQMNLAAQDVGMFSLAEVGGRPAVAFVSMNGELRFTRAAVANGSAWEAPLNINPGPYSNFKSISLAVIAGRPALAVRSANPNGKLWFIRAHDAIGSSWPSAPTLVKASPSDFYFATTPSLAQVNDYTAIAYSEEDGNLGYALSNEDASGPWLTVTVDGSGKQASAISLRLVDGAPAICYLAKGSGLVPPELLKFARSSSSSGINSADWSIITIDETNQVFGSGWLCFEWINNSYAMLIYPASGTGKFKFARASARNGLNNWVKMTIDPFTDSVGCGLVSDAGRPAVFFRTATHIHYMRALSSTGSSWAQPVVLAPLSTGWTAGQLIIGRPALAYTININPNLLAYTYRP
jgi:hypothetical protein